MSTIAVAITDGKAQWPVGPNRPMPVTLSSPDGSGSGGGSSPSVGAANINTGQVSVGSGATLIAAARTGVSGVGRVDITIVNHGSTDVFFGNSGVTSTTGIKLLGSPGSSITITATAAIYGITAGGSQTVSFLETF